MAKAWTRITLDGGGLQSATLALSRARKTRTMAYLLWVAFPLGAHALYLRTRRRAALYALATAGVVGAGWLFGLRPWALALAALEALWALYDLYWIDGRVNAVNKAIRMQVSLRPAAAGATPQAGYRGRYVDNDLDAWMRSKEQERAGHQPLRPPGASSTPRAPSFAEQEAQLRAQSKARKT